MRFQSKNKRENVEKKFSASVQQFRDDAQRTTVATIKSDLDNVISYYLQPKVTEGVVHASEKAVETSKRWGLKVTVLK